jgi:hypothetical protein
MSDEIKVFSLGSLDDLKAALQHEVTLDRPRFNVTDGVVTATKTCSVLGSEYTVRVPLQDYEDWRTGRLAQRAFPYLSSDQREFLMSGTTPAEFDEMFGDDDA